MATDKPFEVWLTVDEIVALGRSKRRVLMSISANEWISKPVPRVGAFGRPSNAVELSSLPEELQRRYAAQRSEEEDDSKFQSTDSKEAGEGARGPSDESRLVEALKRFPADVREAVLDEARRRMGIVQRYEALAKKRQEVRTQDSGLGTEKSAAHKYEFTQAVHDLCGEAKCTNETIINYYKSRQHVVRKGTELRCTRAIAPVTLDNWSRRVRTEGLLVFLPGATDRGAAPISNDGGPERRSLSAHRGGGAARDKRLAKISKEAVQWINSNWRSKPTARSLYQALVKQARKHKWVIPSETWVYRKWQDLPEIVTTALRSQKDYVGRFAPYVPRDYRDLEALQILCGDHSKRDVMVRLPDGSLVRPALTLWQCLRTGLLWGWHLDLTPSSRTIGLAYANGVKTFGAQPLSRPADEFYSYLYTDQGKDYKGTRVGGRDYSFKTEALPHGRATAPFQIDGGLETILMMRRIGLVDDLGLKQILARGYNAREKMIERTHRVLSDWEQSTFPGMYCGRDAKNKPDEWKDAFARHQRLLAKSRSRGPGARGRNSLLLDDSPFWTLDEYRDALAGWITEYNHSAHERVTLGGATVVPHEEYERLYTTRYEISEEVLALLVMKTERRRVGKNGIWLHQRHWNYLHPDLAYFKGQDVEVRYSEDDYSRCFIVTPKAIIEANLVTATTLRNPNKQTLQTIKQQQAHERKIIREHSLLTQSMIRGESIEDRVAAQIEPEEEVVEALAVAAGGGGAFGGQTPQPSCSAGDPVQGHGHVHGLDESNPTRALSGPPDKASVHLFHRLGRRRSGVNSAAARPVTVDEIKATQIDESIFEDSGLRTQDSVVQMWEGEEDNDE